MLNLFLSVFAVITPLKSTGSYEPSNTTTTSVSCNNSPDAFFFLLFAILVAIVLFICLHVNLKDKYESLKSQYEELKTKTSNKVETDKGNELLNKIEQLVKEYKDKSDSK